VESGLAAAPEFFHENRVVEARTHLLGVRFNVRPEITVFRLSQLDWFVSWTMTVMLCGQPVWRLN
jgi:hypothetical protein